MNSQYPSPVKVLVELLFELALPLESQVGRADDQHALGQPAQLELANEQAGHDGLTSPGVVGQQEATPGGFEQMIVNSVELMRQRINPRDRETEVGIVFLGQRDANGFQTELEQARLALERGILALDLDRSQVLVRERDTTTERVGARANQVNQDESVARSGSADDAH